MSNVYFLPLSVAWMLSGVYAAAILNLHGREQWPSLCSNHSKNRVELLLGCLFGTAVGPVAVLAVVLTVHSFRGSLSCKPIFYKSGVSKRFRVLCNESKKEATAWLFNETQLSDLRLQVSLRDTSAGHLCQIMVIDGNGSRLLVYNGPWPITNKDLIDQFAQHAARSLNAA